MSTEELEAADELWLRGNEALWWPRYGGGSLFHELVALGALLQEELVSLNKRHTNLFSGAEHEDLPLLFWR